MKNEIKKYYEELSSAMKGIVGSDASGDTFEVEEAIERAVAWVARQKATDGKLIFIGNGASAAIASHQAVDFWKATKIPALSFNDGALLTCISNDFGYENVFEKPLEVFLDPKDILIAISSSGESENILRAAAAAKKKKARIITLSGFKHTNRLRKLGDLNFYVPALEYGFIEVTHHSICHCILDILVKHSCAV